MKIIILYILFFFACNIAFAQRSISDTTIAFPMIGAAIAFQMPGGDLAERFGNNFNVGGIFQWKLRSNWIIGIEGDYIFGDNVKQDNILDKYKTPDGNIIDANGKYATVTFEERGLKLEIKGGKIFPVIGPNKNSGLMTTLGISYLNHKINIDTPGNPIPYLEEDYKKGYDRLCSGVGFTEFIGYINFGNSRLINYYVGFEFTQAFTKNKREINFDTGLHDGESRIDLLYGIRLGWVFPLYKRSAEKVYFN